MEVKPLNGREAWEKFVQAAENPSLLQSWFWRNFHQENGHWSFVGLVFSQDRPIAGALVVKVPLPLGRSYLYSPRGPLFTRDLNLSEKQMALKTLADFLKNHEIASSSIFWRIDPELSRENLMLPDGFRKANKEIHPKQTVKLDLSFGSDEILSRMKPKTRYNIRLAERKGVKIEKAGGDEGFDAFYTLLEKTSMRQNFQIHSKEHYQRLWRLLHPKNLSIFLAYYNNQTIGGVMIGYYGQTALYLHGASDEEYRSLMSPYLLHWRVIQEAKEMGIKCYDFWGVAPKKAETSHPWRGISRFKEGFGGVYHQYLGAYDLVFNGFWYYVFNKARLWRSLIR